MVNTAERVGIIAALLLSGYAAWESHANSGATENRATKVEVAATGKETNDVLRKMAGRVTDLEARSIQLRELRRDIDLVAYRDCVNENILIGLYNYPPRSLNDCIEEGRTWVKLGILGDNFTDDVGERSIFTSNLR